MPLEHGKGRAAFSRNVREMVNAGHPVKQAVAAAYREKRASDSAVHDYLDCVTRGDGDGMHRHAERMTHRSKA